ncbi:MAG TPA: tRNA (adenosine(37)-N6)-threonylcarbamoyltransferase complex dimerization subunit type 1 TsaB, partial [Chitinophagaceae bacterium]|nr:tRNA (adenosine(37)-N6)-threonylcarbamoyltransferase complex dimerization subunit type 1 TsaB [Chitinophagaceae bacterium]
MPTLLYINTAEKQLEIALSVKEQLFVWNSKVEISSQAQMINIAIEDLLIQAEKSLKDLNAIVICGGPGSYTGLRVGLSTAKGICFALNLPLLMISSLELSLISSYNVKNTNEV